VLEVLETVTVYVSASPGEGDDGDADFATPRLIFDLPLVSTVSKESVELLL
jgi:hypothetical protein